MTALRLSTIGAREPGAGRGVRIVDATLRRRQLIANLVLAFFILLPLEGVLRKWVLQDLQQALVFIREPILLAIYALYMLQPRRSLPTWLAVWMIGLISALGLVFIQLTVSPLPLPVYVLGIRNYLAYIPLAFIMRDTLTTHDISRFVRLAAYISIPIAILVAFQFFSAPSSPINRGLDDSVEGRFLIVAGIVRPYGPFTFVLAQATFSIMMLSLAIIAIDRRRELKLSWAIVSIFLASCFIMGALSGSRSYFIGAAIVLGAYAFASLSSRGIATGTLRLISGIVLATLFVLTFVFVFPTAFDAMSVRQERAVHAEGSTLDRALGMFTGVGAAIERAPPFGIGIGAGSNAGAFVRGETGFWTLGENDWPRTVMEMGAVAGLLYIALRVLLSAGMLLAAVAANRLSGDPSALIMLGFSGPTLLIAQITGQNQMLSFCWFACGLTLAMARTSRERAP